MRYTATRGTSNTTRAAYLYFYGADLTINYSVNQTAYTVTATSNVSGITLTPATADIVVGEDHTVYIETSDISEYVVTDNDTDITELL